jgi:hypothetical protein
MEGQAIFLNCPAYLDSAGAERCGLPAEVEARYTVSSSDGPLDSARIRCPRGHWFNGSIESLTASEQPPSTAASAALLAAVSGGELAPPTMQSRGA